MNRLKPLSEGVLSDTGLIPGVAPYYDDGRFVLYEGNSLELLGRIAPDSVDMVFADPPYNLSNGGFTCHNGSFASVNKGKWDESKGVEEDFEFHRRWLELCRSLLTPSGTIWVSGTYHSIYTCGYAMQLLGFKLLNDIAWFKPNASPNLSCRFFTASHETLIWARKDAKGQHTFNYRTMCDSDWEDDFIKRPNKQMRSVWAIGAPRREEKLFGKHPTQKPLALLDRIVLAGTNEGDLVLDPFAGSGTTGIAAVKRGRRFVGIDNESEYLDLAIKRYERLKTTSIEMETGA